MIQITKKLLNQIWDKCLVIASLKGYEPAQYDRVYFSKEDDYYNMVFINHQWNESDDVYEVSITVEDLNADLEELIRKKKELEEETRRLFVEQQKARQEEIKKLTEQHEKAELKRLKKKYES